MKAAIRTKYCNPASLMVGDLPIPEPSDVEVLVKVKATTVNRTDCGVLTGYPLAIRLFTGILKPKLVVTGTDFSGIIVAKGKNVDRFDIGDYVYGFLDIGISSHAEYVVVPITRAIMRKPDGITFEQAAASIEGAHYAYYFLNKLTLTPETKVLVNGGTGAIGNAAIQFLCYRGVQVTAICDKDYINHIKYLGVKRVIDYTVEDFTKMDEKFDYVFDAVGKSSFGKCKRLLKPKGIYISSELGPYWQNLWMGLIFPLLSGRRIKFPLPLSIVESLQFIDQLLTSGHFIPLIDRCYLLGEISQAFQYVMSGEKKGNVIIRMS